MHCQLAHIVHVETNIDLLGYYLWITDGMSVHDGREVFMTAYYDQARDKQIAIYKDSVHLLPVFQDIGLFLDFAAWKQKRGEPEPKEEASHA